MVFTSATDLLGIGTPPNISQVYRWQRSTGQILLVSRSTSDQPALASCYRPSVSNGGKRVVFDTAAALDPADTNGIFDVYLRDLTEEDDPRTVRFSVSVTGAQGDNASAYACVSGDDFSDSFVAFTSSASNLVPGDTNGRSDVFRTWVTGYPPLVHEVIRVSVNNQGQQSTTTSFFTSEVAGRFIGAFGDVIAFVGAPCDWQDPCIDPGSGAPLNCLCPDPDGECIIDCVGVTQVYVGALGSGRTRRASRYYSQNTGFVPGNGASVAPYISTDGAILAFASYATNWPIDSDPAQDVFAFKMGADTVGIDAWTENPDRMSRPLGGAANNGNSSYPAVGSSGAYHVAFQSMASNLVAGDTNGRTDVFVTDNATHTVRRFSVSTAEQQGNGTSYSCDLVRRTVEQGGDGGDLAVVYTSNATNLVTGDTNSASDIFVTLSRRFSRGDANDDGVVEFVDRDYVFQYLFGGGDSPNCLVAADRNDDGLVNLSDTIACPSCQPPETCCVPPPNLCGLNFTPDTLPCERSTQCQ